MLKKMQTELGDLFPTFMNTWNKLVETTTATLAKETEKRVKAINAEINRLSEESEKAAGDREKRKQLRGAMEVLRNERTDLTQAQVDRSTLGELLEQHKGKGKKGKGKRA